jgi:hydrogenase expression/formation protein HypE
MCQVADLGCEVYEDQIPVDQVTVKIANHFDIDYLRLISSGCMIIVADPDRADKIQEAVAAEGIEICCIGEVKEKAFGVMALKNGELSEIEPPESDELYRAVK